jgi:hypothetical protein
VYTFFTACEFSDAFAGDVPDIVAEAGTAQGDPIVFAPNPNEFNYNQHTVLGATTLTGFVSSITGVFDSSVAVLFVGLGDTFTSSSSALSFRFGLV